jgi:hypothetical protein
VSEVKLNRLKAAGGNDPGGAQRGVIEVWDDNKDGLVTCTAMLFALVAGLMAQSPYSTQRSAKPINVTGCIQRAAERETKFLLTNVVMSVTSADGTIRLSPGMAIEELHLDVDEATLTPLVGHRVQIDGTVEQPARTISAQSKAGVSPVRLPALLKVDTVRLIASACM